jgi:hypothetical protein
MVPTPSFPAASGVEGALEQTASMTARVITASIFIGSTFAEARVSAPTGSHCWVSCGLRQEGSSGFWSNSPLPRCGSASTTQIVSADVPLELSSVRLLRFNRIQNSKRLIQLWCPEGIGIINFSHRSFLHLGGVAVFAEAAWPCWSRGDGDSASCRRIPAICRAVWGRQYDLDKIDVRGEKPATVHRKFKLTPSIQQQLDWLSDIARAGYFGHHGNGVGVVPSIDAVARQYCLKQRRAIVEAFSHYCATQLLRSGIPFSS